MPQVTVKDLAHCDPRLRLAGRLLRMNHERVGWRLIHLWSLATSRNSPIIGQALAAEAIGRKPEDVAHAFVEAELADQTEDGRLDLSAMASLFGDCKWLDNIKGTASAGGQVRAANAERAPDGTFVSRTRGKPMSDRIVERLGAGRHSREELRAALRCRNADMLQALNQLIDDGVVVDEDGMLSLAVATESVPGMEREPGIDSRESNGNRPVPGIGNRESIPGTGPESDSHTGEREPSSALAPSLSLAPTHTSAREGIGNRESAEPVDELASDVVVPRHRRHDIARMLWAYQNRCRAELDSKASSLPLNEAPGGQLDQVVLRLATYTPKQCRYALDMFKLEGKYLRDDGENPLQYLNGFTNWKQEPLGRRVGTTAAAIAQEVRARKAKRRRSSTDEQPRKMEKLN